MELRNYDSWSILTYMDVNERIIRARETRGPITGATGELVLTEKGEMEHRQGSFDKTFCGKLIDRDRTARPDREEGYFPCLSCDKIERSRFR